ncbi:MAG TPA: thermonuclease family protein [Tepidisphaeraceae bacterium]|jgi:micrococcal nuclease|nr:thermonuclease family protein [Tepidisphaeraceae bacterium]
MARPTRDISIPDLLRRRGRYRKFGWGALILVFLSILLDRSGTFGYHGDDWSRFDKQSVQVVHVSDGDSIIITDAGSNKQTKVRLIGVDTPELEGDQYWAQQAHSYTRGRLANRSVTLKLDGTQTRDRYDRLLAYVYVTDSDNLNLALVRDGQAYADRRHDHSMRAQLESTEAEARKKGRGLWKDVRDDQQPQWRQDWLKRRR